MQTINIEYDGKQALESIDGLVKKRAEYGKVVSEQNKLIISLQDENQRLQAKIITLEEEVCWLHRVVNDDSE